MVVVNRQRCPLGPPWRSWVGATIVGAYRAKGGPLRTCRSNRRRGHPRPVAGIWLSPAGLGPLPLGGLEGKPARVVERCRPAIAGGGCVLRPHRGLAAWIALSTVRSNRGHDPRTNRHPPSCRRVSQSRRPRRRGDRAPAWSTHHVGTAHGGRSRR